jgi:hypothetical protein
MALDANAEEDLGQRSSCATVGVGDAHMLDKPPELTSPICGRRRGTADGRPPAPQHALLVGPTAHAAWPTTHHDRRPHQVAQLRPTLCPPPRDAP